MKTEIEEITEDKVIVRLIIERPENGMIMANGVAIPFDEYVKAWKEAVINPQRLQPSIGLYPTKAQEQCGATSSTGVVCIDCLKHFPKAPLFPEDIVSEFYSGKYDDLTIKEFREKMNE